MSNFVAPCGGLNFNTESFTVQNVDGKKVVSVKGGKQEQVDWNQNDSTKPDFIKNRPFGTATMHKVDIVPKGDYNFVQESPGRYNWVMPDGFNASTASQTMQKYPKGVVEWDGTAYTLNIMNGLMADDASFMGNLSLISYGPDTGEPMCVNGAWNGSYFNIKTGDDSPAHNVHIYAIQGGEVSPIDPKYLTAKPGLMDENGTGEVFNAYVGFSKNTAGGEYAHAEGKRTHANGTASHAEGEGTVADSDGAHAEGVGTDASGAGAHAEGGSTVTVAMYSHAEGEKTFTSGEASHAEGIGTQSMSEAQHVQGKYNLSDDTNKYAHIVGNGTSIYSPETDEDVVTRSNCHTLDWEGNAWYSGEVTAKGIIVSSSTPESVKQFRITVTDDGAIKAEEIV